MLTKGGVFLKRYVKIIAVLIPIVMTLCACGSSVNTVSKVNYIYFLGESTNNIVKIDYNIGAEDTDKIVSELIKNMDIDSNEGDYFSAKPESVKAPEFEIAEKVLTLHFDNTYSEMKSSQEILYRAALVLTMVQVPGISYVNIYVGDQPLLDSDGLPLGNMTENDFVDLSGGLEDLKQDISLLMYYPNKDGDLLYEKTYEGKLPSDKSLEELVVEKLSGKAYSKDSEIYSVATRNGVCYLDFSKEFNLEHLDIDDKVAIYSIVNSLCELSNVSRVKISVDGVSDIKFHENISLNQNFTRNLDLVEK